MNITIDDFSTVFLDNGRIEANRSVLNAQSNNIKRFGESALRDHPQRDVVASAIKFLQPEQLVVILQDTTKALQGNPSQLWTPQDANIPKLASEPFSFLSKTTMSSGEHETSLSASARMIGLLGKINQLTGDVTLQQMVDQLKIYNMQLSDHSQAYNTLAEQLEVHAQQWANDYDELAQAHSQVGELKKMIDAKTQEISAAQDALVSLQILAEKELDEKGIISPELNKKIEDEKYVIREKYNDKDRLLGQRQEVVDNRLKPAQQAESVSKTSLENLKKQAQALLGTISIQQASVIEYKQKQQNENAKSLSYLLAVISQLINESASDDLQAGASLKQKMAESAAKSTEKKAREFEVEQRKAEELQKTMGCIGKIIGWVITGISFIAAIPTGGASLALAGIGLALAVGDEIYQAATGKSFIEQALTPLMESVIQPLMNFLAKNISSLLQGMGVDKGTADLIGNIIGAIVVAVAIIVLAVLASSFAGRILSSIGTKLATTSVVQTSRAMMNRVMKRIIDNNILKMLKNMTSTISQKLGSRNIIGERSINVLKQANNIAAGANTGLHTALNITSSVYQMKADTLRAGILESITLQQLLNELMDRMVDGFSHRISSANAIIENMATVAENQIQAGKYITHKIRNVAG